MPKLSAIITLTSSLILGVGGVWIAFNGDNGDIKFTQKLPILPETHEPIGTLEEQKTFNQSWKDWGRSIFPGTGWSPLNRKHTLSFSFYLLEKRMLLQNEGSPFSMLELDGRVILLHNQSPRWSWHTLKSSPVSAQLNPRNIEIHLRLYINLMMLFLSGDYKQDQLHLPTILLRRR